MRIFSSQARVEKRNDAAVWLCEYAGLSFQRLSGTRLLACLVVALYRGYDEPRNPLLYQPSDWVTLGGFPNRW